MSLLNADRKDHWSVGRTTLRERVIVLGGAVAIVIVARTFDWLSWRGTFIGAAAYALASQSIYLWILRKLDQEARPEADPYSEP
jgi:hypothetical protein